MKRRNVFIFAALIAATWLSVWDGSQQPKKPAASRDAQPSSVLAASTAPPSSAAPRALAPRRQTLVSDIVTAGAAVGPSIDRQIEQMGAPSGASRSPARDSLKGTWHSEPHDEAKTKEMHAFMLETAAAAALTPDVIQETDCGATVCRVLLSFKRAEEALTFQALAQRPDLQYEINSSGRAVFGEGEPGSAPAGESSDEPELPLDGRAPAATRLAEDGTPEDRAPAGGVAQMDFEVLMASNQGREPGATVAPEGAP